MWILNEHCLAWEVCLLGINMKTEGTIWQINNRVWVYLTGIIANVARYTNIDLSGNRTFLTNHNETAKMNLSFDDQSLDNLDPTISLNDPSDIDTALLNDIDGKNDKLTCKLASKTDNLNLVMR